MPKAGSKTHFSFLLRGNILLFRSFVHAVAWQSSVYLSPPSLPASRWTPSATDYRDLFLFLSFSPPPLVLHFHSSGATTKPVAQAASTAALHESAVCETINK
ncbi:hypothetical protein CGRA01v4_05206 [Colletotrichum graminicola]|nr:hypothetical protein CGRA01v4_05206 [Colletotrichum graminicola]